MIPHPIPYQGSKRRLAGAIISHFPQDIATLIEPFAGSAAVSLAAVYHGKANRVVLNDVNEPLMALWQAIVQEPETLSGAYRSHWEKQQGNEREYYDTVRDSFNTTRQPGDLLYLLARCVKASVRYNARGEFNQSPDNRRSGARPDTVRQHIHQAAELFSGRVSLHSEDYRSVLARADNLDVIYMDPPYQGVGNGDNRYLAQLSYDDFVHSLEELNRRGMSYIVSYDGRTGKKEFGKFLPPGLGLQHIEVAAGLSSQATLLGRRDETYESLYLSRALVNRLRT